MTLYLWPLLFVCQIGSVAYFHGEALLKGCPSATKVKISTIVIGELYHGFYGGKRFTENVRILNEFLVQPVVELVPVCCQTAEVFGEMIAPLKNKGVTIPTNDIWVAAVSFVNQTTLLTSDSNFKYFPQVRTVMPSR